MPIIRMNSYMSADLAATFQYDITGTVTIGLTGHTALLNNQSTTELDESGGPIEVNLLELHFMASDVASIVSGTFVTTPQGRKMVISSILSADGSELIVNTRDA